MALEEEWGERCVFRLAAIPYKCGADQEAGAKEADVC